MKIGIVVHQKFFNGATSADDTVKYQQLLKTNFKNVGMFAFGQMPMIAQNGPDPERDYNWQNIDKLLAFTEANNIEVHYNTIVNHYDSAPQWFKDLPPDQKKAALEKHIRAVVSRYRGRIKIFKLVNEAFRFESDNFWGTNTDAISLITDIFRWAKEEYPEGVFLLNDHIPFLPDDELTHKYLDFIKRLLANGAPIDAIGLEGHIGYRPTFKLPTDDQIEQVLTQFYQVSGLPLYITEFDLSYNNAPNQPYPGSDLDPERPFNDESQEFANWWQYQAYAYKHFLEICLTKDYVAGVTFWGFYDDPAITWERPGTGFIDQNFQPKPNLLAIQQLLNSNIAF